MGKFSHSPVRFALTVIMAVLFVVQLVFNGLSGVPVASGGVFLSTVGDVSDVFYVEITPSGWTFSIWGFIYTWQALWIIYSLTLLGRKSSTGYLYVSPEVISLATILVYILSIFLNVTWLFVWDRKIINAALPVLFSTAVSLYVAIFLSHRRHYSLTPALLEEGKRADVWLVRLLVHNGLAFYATWCTIATLLNLAVVIAYSSDPAIAQDVASTVSLSVLSAEIILWFSLDIFLLDKYTRYTFSPYIVLVVALSGVIDKNYVTGRRNSIFSAVLLSVAIATLITKILTLFWRHCKKPIHPAPISPTTKDLPPP